jgi:hypothetical protein
MIYPEKNTSDKVADSIKAGAQLIPFGVGGAIIEVVSSFVPLGYENRRDNWLRSIGLKIENLPDSIHDLIKIYIESEEGKTLLICATSSAIETHKLEKLNSLSNVLLGVIQEEQMHYDQKEIFVTVLSSLEPYDLHLLTIISEQIFTFKFIYNYEEAYNFSKNHGFMGSKDEFTIIINRLKTNSLLRVSDHVDGFYDVYSADVLVTESTNDLPKFLVTGFAVQLIEYLTDKKA